MSDNERRVRLARACGWRVVESADWLSAPDGDIKIPVWSLWQPDGKEQPKLYDTPADAWAAAPDIEHDLAACIDAFNVLSAKSTCFTYHLHNNKWIDGVRQHVCEITECEEFAVTRYAATPAEACYEALCSYCDVGE